MSPLSSSSSPEKKKKILGEKFQKVKKADLIESRWVLRRRRPRSKKILLYVIDIKQEVNKLLTKTLSETQIEGR